MKLYEFTITDNENLTDNKVLELAEQILKSEASSNGWTNCILTKEDTVEKLPNGDKRYHFSIHGDAAQEFEIEEDSKAAPSAPAKEKIAASPA